MLDRRKGIMTICILAAMLLSPLLYVSVAQAQEVAVHSNESIYKLGETVTFTFTGLEPEQSYQLVVSRGGTEYTVSFITDSEGNPTSDVSWSTDSVDPGTYTYVLYKVVGEGDGEKVGEGRFGIVGINKESFAADEEIIIKGGGATDEVTAELRNDSTVIATGSASPDDNGEFTLSIKIPYNAANGTYSVIVNVSGSEVVFEIDIETTSSQLLENTEQLFDDLLGTVSGINASIVNSLTAKLTNAKMKVEAAEELLAEGRTHVARNMLRAARNMLTAFIHEVRAQRGKHLDETTADELIRAAQSLIDRIDFLMTQLKNQNTAETTSVLGKKGRGGDGDEDRGGGKGKNNENHGRNNNGNHKGKKK